MATSRSENLGSRFAGYLGSTRNIVGSVAALGALGATVPTGVAGPLWPLVVAGTYGIGALLSPRERASFAPSGFASTRAQAAELQGHLAELGARVRRYDNRLPDDVLAAYGRIEEGLSEVLVRADSLTAESDRFFVVGRIVDDYLPAALETYANLPRSFAMRHRAEGRRTAHEELLHQLGIIETQIEQIAAAIYAGDAETLAARSRFLEDRFADSSLRLPPRP